MRNDHWMRSDEVARGRECIYPVVNRASHESEYGTFLDSWHDKRYFKTIVRQRSRFDWPSDAWRPVLSDVYEDRVRGLLASAEHVSDVNAAVVRAVTERRAGGVRVVDEQPPVGRRVEVPRVQRARRGDRLLPDQVPH